MSARLPSTIGALPFRLGDTPFDSIVSAGSVGKKIKGVGPFAIGSSFSPPIVRRRTAPPSEARRHPSFVVARAYAPVCHHRRPSVGSASVPSLSRFPVQSRTGVPIQREARAQIRTPSVGHLRNNDERAEKWISVG